MKSRLGVTRPFLAILIALAQPCLATVAWDIQVEWSDAANPNGVWVFREGGNVLGHVAAWQQPGLGYVQPAWAVGEVSPNEYLPSWFKATGTVGGLDWEVGDVVVHTTDPANGPTHGNASVRWVSPVADTIAITGSVWITRDIGRSAAWTLLRNATPLTGGSVSSGDPYSRANPFDFAAGSGGAGVLQGIPMQVGDFIELSLVTTSSNTLGDMVGVNLLINGAVTGVGDGPARAHFVLHDPVPNPFNPSTTIAFDVPAGGADVSISIYDVTGRRVRGLMSGRRDAGTGSVTWNGLDDRGVGVASGVYLVRVTAGDFEGTRKITLAK